MRPTETVYVILCVVAISVGQILFKLTASSTQPSGSAFGFVLHALLNPYLVSGLALYGVATIAWVWLLRSIPLNVAYPFMSLAFIFVPLLSHVVFQEPFKLTHAIGGGLIIVGVTIASR
jgi:drug/metabolite transporter (DMT)-like permease